MPERVILTIGTKKGVFVAEAPKARGRFALRGPFGKGVAVNATLVDTRYVSLAKEYFNSDQPDAARLAIEALGHILPEISEPDRTKLKMSYKELLEKLQ